VYETYIALSQGSRRRTNVCLERAMLWNFFELYQLTSARKLAFFSDENVSGASLAM
jgi:hypothetical protein